MGNMFIVRSTHPPLYSAQVLRRNACLLCGVLIIQSSLSVIATRVGRSRRDVGQDLPVTLQMLRAGPRRQLQFKPSEVAAAIVTCGGLCPGLNSVIRELVMMLYAYGVRKVPRHLLRHGMQDSTNLSHMVAIEGMLCTPDVEDACRSRLHMDTKACHHNMGKHTFVPLVFVHRTRLSPMASFELVDRVGDGMPHDDIQGVRWALSKSGAKSDIDLVWVAITLFGLIRWPSREELRRSVHGLAWARRCVARQQTSPEGGARDAGSGVVCDVCRWYVLQCAAG